jgi:alkylated DNA nucleotide flippase Atl1
MTREERALQVWQVLIGAAHNRQTFTYGGIGELIGVPAVAMGPILGHIMRYCECNRLPPLTVLIVGAGSGQPSHGLTASQDRERDREIVYGFDWYSRVPLQANDLGDA